MKRKKSLIKLTTVLILLTFLISSCATSIPAGFIRVNEGDTVPHSGQLINDDGARDVAKRLTERNLCIEKLGKQPSYWDKFSSGFTIFGIGAGVGLLTGIIILP